MIIVPEDSLKFFKESKRNCSRGGVTSFEGYEYAMVITVMMRPCIGGSMDHVLVDLWWI
jgi:hypothetical protein